MSFIAYNTPTKKITMSQNPREINDNMVVHLIVNQGRVELMDLLYRRYSKKVYYRCLKIVKDSELAKDLAQDVILKAFANLAQFKGKSFGMWLNAIAYNYCIDYIRKNKRLYFESYEENQFQDREADNEGVLAKIRQEERLEQLDTMIEMLKPKDKLVIKLRYYNGMSIKEISDKTGFGVSATKMRIKRAKEKLVARASEMAA
jgi:RNA polymerase sigma-70 factor (ECF subfamily)